MLTRELPSRSEFRFLSAILAVEAARALASTTSVHAAVAVEVTMAAGAIRVVEALKAGAERNVAA